MKPKVIRILRFLGTFLAVLACPLAHAEVQTQLKNVYLMYSQGAYLQALEELKTIRGDTAVQANISYLKGLCQSRLQKFDEAKKEFTTALSLNSPAADLHYELGQALYASQDFKAAQREFNQSVKNQYKVPACNYYIGFIFQMHKQPAEAGAFYKRVIDFPEDPDKVKQSALFQVAEIRFAAADNITGSSEKHKKEKVKSYLFNKVIPEYEKAADFESGTTIAMQAESRIGQIEAQFGEGKKAKKWFLSATQDTQYDSNVTSEADNAVVKVTNKDSFIFKPTVETGINHSFGGFEVNPKFSVAYKKHSNQTESSVFTNDELKFDPVVQTGFKNTLFDKPGRFSINLDTDYSIRDTRKDHTLQFYSWEAKGTVGENLSYFQMGSTTLNGSVKYSKNSNDNISAWTYGVSLSQVVDLVSSGAYKLMPNATADIKKAVLSKNNTNTYKATLALVSPPVFWDLKFKPSFTFTIEDPRLQRTARGYELTYNPTARVSRPVIAGLEGHIDYSFTKKTSKDTENYAYNKHVVELRMRYEF